MKRLFDLLNDFAFDLSWAPWFWSFALFLPLFGLFFLRHYKPSWLAPFVTWGNPLRKSVACLIIAAFLGADAIYCLSSSFWDHAEPTQAIGSWMFWRGDPVYHDLQTQQRYSAVYGPYAFILEGYCQGLIGPSVFSSKLLACAAGAGAICLFYLILFRRTSARVALLFTSLLAALCLRLGPFAFWARSDPLLLLCATVGLLAATRKSIASIFILGVSVGIAINLKVHSVVYFLPVAVVAAQSAFGRRELVRIGLIAAAVALLPFVIFPQISLQNYCALLRLASGRTSGLLEYRLTWEWFITLCIPIVGPLMFFWLTSSGSTERTDSKSKLYLAAILGGFAVTLIFASKHGAGPHHLLPFIPSILLFAAEQTYKGRGFRWQSNILSAVGYALCFSWLTSCTLVALRSAWSVSADSIRHEAEARASIHDLQEIVDQHPSLTLLGGAPLGGQPVYSSYHLQLVFNGMPPGINPPMQMDYQLAKVAESDLAKLEKELEEKYHRPIAWIVPKGAQPISMKTAYQPDRPLLSEKFHQDFAARFEKAESSRYFDLYRAKPK